MLLLALAGGCPAEEDSAEERREERPPPPPPIEASHLDASYGPLFGGALAQPAWVVATLDLTANRALRRVTLHSIELLAADGSVVARGISQLELRIASDAPIGRDYSTWGSRPFDGRVAAGSSVRLRAAAGLDRTFNELTPRPASYRAVLRAGALEIAIEGPLGDPWPSG
jgi:hypothetical protein